MRILIVDDHAAVVEGVRSVVSEVAGTEVVGTVMDGLDAIENVESLKPDIVIMDISMPHMNGVETTKRIREGAQDCNVIAYSMYSDREYVLALFKAGVAAYVLKELPMSELFNAVNAVQGGANYYSEPIRQIVQDYMLESERGDEKLVHDIAVPITNLSDRETSGAATWYCGLSSITFLPSPFQNRPWVRRFEIRRCGAERTHFHPDWLFHTKTVPFAIGK